MGIPGAMGIPCAMVFLMLLVFLMLWVFLVLWISAVHPNVPKGEPFSNTFAKYANFVWPPRPPKRTFLEQVCNFTPDALGD